MPGMEMTIRIAAIGIGATLLMDLWGLVQHRAFGAPTLNYRLVGRWLGHIPLGRFRHESIAKASPVPGEAALGWAAHYATGVLFAALLVAVYGPEWVLSPTIWPALLIGIATIAAPFLVLQPAIGLGLAASKTPDPTAARLRSCVTHLVFGIGLYVCADVIAYFLTN